MTFIEHGFKRLKKDGKGIMIDQEKLNYLLSTDNIVYKLTTRLKWKVCCKN